MAHEGRFGTALKSSLHKVVVHFIQSFIHSLNNYHNCYRCHCCCCAIMNRDFSTFAIAGVIIVYW